MALSVLRRITSLRPSGKFARSLFVAKNKDLDLPAFGKTLEEQLKEKQVQDPAIYYQVDIGLPRESFSKRRDNTSDRVAHVKKLKSDVNLEKLSRHGKLEIPMDEVRQDWLKEKGTQHVKEIAEHYGVFQHLFGDAYFFPRVPLDVAYDQGDDVFAPVCFGNQLKPKEVLKQPVIQFKSDPDTFWTLVLTNPDGHLTKENSEYVHWMIGNIPGSDVSKGDVIFDYLQPFPLKGVGYQRMVFVLYKQEKKLEFSQLKKSQPSLADRTFSTYEFYRDRQDVMTPAGLAFFQTDWDRSVTDFFHSTLGLSFDKLFQSLNSYFSILQDKRNPFTSTIFQSRSMNAKLISLSWSRSIYTWTNTATRKT
ncbi:Hypothetical predicted protein [Cloeon dipterum]|uniref:Large ribosomal subunit protein mL38 n=1 Tax=Cloeon dipterum TaxID=197152 RepID=A0A8S1CP61_9INSE|nr:Hypothetical predicted protein [Cloeon dipterum]